MIRFPSSLQRRQHINTSLTTSALVYFHQQFRFSSASSSLDEVPSSQEVLTAFNTLGITGSSLHELSRKGDSATSEQSVKKRFLELAKQQHPDVSKDSNTKKTMSEINGAYKVLKNFFKAGGFPKFVSSSSSSSSYSQTAGGAYYQTPYESQQQSNYSDTGFYDNENSEFFWAGFEDVIKNHPHFKNQNPNAFHKKNRGTSSSSSSKSGSQRFYTSAAPPGGNPFGRMFVDDEELRQAAGQAAGEGADFFYTEHDFGGPNGEDVSPEEAFEIFQRYQQHMHGSGFYGGGGPTSSPMGESFTYDDARTIRDADDFFAQQHFHPFQFEFVDFDEGEIPPGYHFHFDDQFHPGARRGGRKNNNNRNYRGNTNHSRKQQHQGKGGKKHSSGNNNNGKPWQNPDQFFKDSFNHPNRNQHHQHQKSSASSSTTAKNSAGVNLSPEEYEAILNMHADGQSFMFIANSLGLTEKQAIAGFNIAKKKQREEERHQHKKNHSDASFTSNTNKSSSAEKSSSSSSSSSSTTNKNTDTSTSAKQQNSKKEVFDVDDDAADHDEKETDSSQHFKSSAVKNDQRNNNSNKNYKFVKIEDVDEEIDDHAPDTWDPYDDGEYPQPFTGKPMHHHAMGRKLRNHGNNNSNKQQRHQHQNHNQKQKQKWRNHGGGGGGGNKKKFSSHSNKKRR